MAEVVEITLELVGVLIQIQITFAVRIYPWFVYSTSVLPYMQLSWFIRLSGISYNNGKVLGMHTNTVVVNGNDVAVILYIAYGVLGTMLLILFYQFPLLIASNSKNSRSRLYCIRPREWGCPCISPGRTTTAAHHESDDEVEEEMDPLQNAINIE